MEFLSAYGIFLLKLISVVVAILIIMAVFFSLIGRSRAKIKGKLVVTKLNEKYDDYQAMLTRATKDKQAFKSFLKHHKKNKKNRLADAKEKKRLFILNFQGDLRASAVHALREEITAILTLAEPTDTVLIRLESSGGLVNAYGLAASQLQRLKDANLPLSVAIDKVAASGGYMMACVADQIIAAPFAIIGSIGVVVQLPNFHRFLQKKYIDFEQITAGEFKRTLTLFGENTQKDREKMQKDIDDTHVLFKTFIQQHRQSVDIDKVATGEYWYATRAKDLNLIDELKTSDDFLLQASKTHHLYELSFKTKKSFFQRFGQGTVESIEKLFSPYSI